MPAQAAKRRSPFGRPRSGRSRGDTKWGSRRRSRREPRLQTERALASKAPFALATTRSGEGTGPSIHRRGHKNALL